MKQNGQLNLFRNGQGFGSGVLADPIAVVVVGGYCEHTYALSSGAIVSH